MKRSRTLIRVAATLMAAPDDRHYGYDVWRRSGISSGTMYPILWRMLSAGWLTDGWEDPAPVGRPPRRYYELTGAGKDMLEALLAVSDQ